MTIKDLPSISPVPHTGHAYRAVSAHNTSEGRVVYQRCACGLWRIQRNTRVGGTAVEATVDQRVPAVAVAPRPDGPVYASI